MSFACLVNLSPHAVQSQGRASTAHEFREVHLGMEVRIALVDASADAAAANARAAYGEIERLEAILSDWRPQSELSALADAGAGEWIAISAPLRDVLALALRVARATDGAFDPTVGPLTRLWREARRTGRPIGEAARAQALERVGHRHLTLDSAGSRLRFAREGMRLDLGAVAKGFIIDRALDALEARGVRSALIEAGGDLAVRGAPPGEPGWRIAVPRARGDTLLVLDRGAVSTSGSSMQRLEDGRGGMESHVIDARLGRGLRPALDVTVLGPSAALTDALATALSLTPSGRRAALAASFGVSSIAP